MPSCSSKLWVLLKNESADSVENVSVNNTLISRYLVGATLILYYIFDTPVLLCRVTNVSSTQNHNSGGLYRLPKHYVSEIRNLIHVLLFLKCEINKIQNIQRYNSVVLQLINHNVICLCIVYFLLRFSLHFISVKKFSGSLNQFYGNIFDMAVDETNLLENGLPNGDKLNSSEDVSSTVINENQIMIKSEYEEFNKSVNSIDVKIKEEVKETEGTILNGDVVNNCCADSEKSLDLNEISQPVKDDNVKEEVNTEKITDNSDAFKVKEEKSNEVLNNQQINNNTEKVESSESKTNDVKSSKDKPRDKDQCYNNHVSSSSSSSSSKKYDSQSRSHQSSSSSSSSSSRHKYKDSRDDKHKSSSSSSRSNELSSSSSRRDEERSKERSKERSCHHKPEDKCHCKSRHRSHHHSKTSKKLKSVKTQCTPDEIAFELNQNKFEMMSNPFTRVPWTPHPQLTNLKYGKFIRIEIDRNGGASVCHLYMDEISHLTESQMKECASEFIKLSYSEDENECAYHVMGIVHGAASYLPDLVDYMADHYPTLIVKTGSLASRDNHTTTMAQYRDEVYKTYSNGSFRYAPLDQLSICGVLGEEVGAYFPDFVARLEQSPFMKPVMPWSSLSVVETDNPRESNDGPIFWVRPGEQMLPANEALKESARPKKRRNNELDNLAYIGGSRFSEARESLFQDRTKAHADQVGVDYGISNTAPTAAVGVLKAVNCGHPEHGNRATKDVVAFHAQDYSELLEILMLDLYEPPQTQCTKWIEVSKLNTLRREGIRYAHLKLHDNDVYYLPRKIIHQFQTISSVASVAWHIRYRDYFSILGAPNLHTPTGINKGQVFYEKKNVAVYCPPVCENELLAAVTNGEPGLKTPKKVDRLKEYSPFKHSPRKLHKHPSKKHSQLNNTVKNELSDNKTYTPEKEVKSSSSSVSKDESRKTSESSHSRRSSGEHTPSKKEHHSSHRKEVKNLSSEFSSKSNHEKSPHGSRKHSSESSKRRHEDSSKRKDKHGSHSSKTEDKNSKDDGGLKRKHGESSSHTPSKKLKEDNSTVENGKKSPKRDVASENQSNNLLLKEEVVIDCKKSSEVNEPKLVNNVTSENGVSGPEETQTNCQKTNNQIVDFDLRQQQQQQQHVSYAAFMGQVPTFPLPPPPPPPPNSPPANPPPPPSPPAQTPDPSPGKDTNSVSHKEKSDAHVKKVKKKILKKTNENYDLLGDIMSKMDKKK